MHPQLWFCKRRTGEIQLLCKGAKNSSQELGSPWFAQDTTPVTRVWQRDPSDGEEAKPGCFLLCFSLCKMWREEEIGESTHTHWHKAHSHTVFLYSRNPLESSARLVEEKPRVSCKTQKHKSSLWARKSLSRDCREQGGCAGGNVRMCLSLLAACSGWPCTDLGQARRWFLSPGTGVSQPKAPNALVKTFSNQELES